MAERGAETGQSPARAGAGRRRRQGGRGGGQDGPALGVDGCGRLEHAHVQSLALVGVVLWLWHRSRLRDAVMFGAACTATSTLREVVDGRKLRFDVEVKEGERTIGVGTHERRVVHVASHADTAGSGT